MSVGHVLVGRFLVALCRLITGVSARWQALPDLSRPTLFYANHSSHLDGLVIWACMPPALRRQVRPVAAADYWLAKPLRRYLALEVFNAVLVERGAAASGSPTDPLLAMKQALSEGHSLIIFPEGTRGTGDELQPFKSGLFHLSRQFPEVALVPVWLENLSRVLPKGSRLVVPVICTAWFGAAQPGAGADEDKQGFLARCRQALEELAP